MLIFYVVVACAKLCTQGLLSFGRLRCLAAKPVWRSVICTNEMDDVRRGNKYILS